MNERTLVLLKPDSLQRGLVGQIISRFERVGLNIIGLKMLVASPELIAKHYPTQREEFIAGLGQKTLENNQELGLDTKAIFGTTDPHQIGLKIQAWNAEFMTSGPLIALALEGPGAIALVRKLRGFTLPSKADPGTITGDFSFDSSAVANTAQRPIRNLVHASGNAKEAEFEVNLWFEPGELLSNQSINQVYMLS